MKRKYNWFKSLLSLFLCFALSITYVMAQQTVSGTVTDENGEGLPGVNVVVKGTTQGATTNIDGKYTIKVPSTESVLVYTYISYATQEITVGAQSTIDVQMQLSATAIEELVVIGYGGAVKKEDATGSVTTISTEKFNKGFVTSAQDLLVGRAAGVQISASDGTPGGGANIRIRGNASLSASSAPLFVVDGVLFADGTQSGISNPLSVINPNDIESITILKDASATAIYGNRGSNGVILIKTKSGKDGKAKFSYNGNVGVSVLPNQLEVLNADQYRTLINDRIALNDPNVPAVAASLLGTANTNWQDEIFRTAITTDHNLSVSGKYKSLPYRVSAGFTNQQGTLNTSNFRRFTGAFKLDPEFLGGDLKISLDGKAMLARNNFADGGAVGAAVGFDPTQSVLTDGSPWGGYFYWPQAGSPLLPNTVASGNPVALLELRDNQADVNRFIFNAQADYKLLIEGLNLHIGGGTDRTTTDGEDILSSELTSTLTSGRQITRYEAEYNNDFFESWLTYDKEFGASKLNLQAGYSWQHLFQTTPVTIERELLPTIDDDADGNPGENYLVAFFGRALYTLKDRYIFTFTYRRDGTSRFLDENQWGNFPSAAFAWKIKEETFLKDVDFVQALKLRIGYGVTGQQNLGTNFYPALGLVTAADPTAVIQFGDNFITPLRFEGFNEDLRWETTKTTNIGLDFTLTKSGRLIGSVDYYFRETEDLLNTIPTAQGSNFTNLLLTNIGNLENEGVEISLDAVLIDKPDFTLDFGINVTRNVSKITKLIAVDDPDYLGVFTGGISGGTGNTAQIHTVGSPVNSFFLHEQVYDEDGNPIEGLYVDQNEDGVINNSDRVISGNPFPDVFFGFSTRLTYKNFTFSANSRLNLGQEVYNNVHSNQGLYQGLYNSAGSLSNVPSISSTSQFTSGQFLSDFYLSGASFFRMDNISFGYRLPEVGGGKVSLGLNFTIQNAFVITNYDGLDPEINSGTAPGIDNNFYPRPRIFLLGLNANF